MIDFLKMGDFLGGALPLIIFGGAFLIFMVSLIVSLVSGKRNEMAKKSGDFITSFDPLTGLPYNVLNKEKPAIIEEVDEEKRTEEVS